MISLIHDKGYDAITVEDICEEAKIGRSTFYLHYAGKDDLKRKGLDHLRAELIERQRRVLAAENEEDRRLGFSLALFEHASDHVYLYRALTGSRGADVALECIREILSDLVRAELAETKRGKTPHEIPREFVVQYLVGACMALLTWWLDRGAEPPPKEMDRMFRRLAAETIASIDQV